MFVKDRARGSGSSLCSSTLHEAKGFRFTYYLEMKNSMLLSCIISTNPWYVQLNMDYATIVWPLFIIFPLVELSGVM
ncbi:hypothetical protein PIB30_026132 [Stylosanthes scabra]|uniref:Uncharacterized protein n=1 Tax=Stylosanthes scabra TaxID=79078 RepID=A0ABU6UC35_9FABA|nr:hypothetical protein [Stylosanthes scabra]